MTDTGDLIHGDTYAFDFRIVEPQPQSPHVLLVLLHGVGADEHQLEALGARLHPQTLAVLPRGQRTISGGRLGWFREGLSDDGPQVVIDEADEARTKLVDFIAQLQRRFDVDPNCTVLAGFSQGGMLAASAALTAPHCVGGFAMLCGRIPPEIEPMLGDGESLSRLEALVVHGRDDATLPVDWAHRAGEWLTRLHVRHELRLHDAAHELAGPMEEDLLRWLGHPARAWNSSLQMRDGAP